jgi:hypothetical protein
MYGVYYVHTNVCMGYIMYIHMYVWSLLSSYICMYEVYYAHTYVGMYVWSTYANSLKL